MAGAITKERVKRLEIFKGLGNEECEKIARLCTEETFEKDQILFNEGEYGRKVYVVESGRINFEILAAKDHRVIVGQEVSGGLCGWSAALEPYIYTARAVVVEKATVFVIDAEALQSLCDIHANICVIFTDFLLKTVVKRLDQLRKWVAEVLYYSQGYLD